jgi:hypothetical protein
MKIKLLNISVVLGIAGLQNANDVIIFYALRNRIF